RHVTDTLSAHVYTLSLHDALPISDGIWEWEPARRQLRYSTRFRALLGYTQFDQLPQSLLFWLRRVHPDDRHPVLQICRLHLTERDRKSTRLNSSHVKISYAVFCLQ